MKIYARSKSIFLTNWCIQSENMPSHVVVSVEVCLQRLANIFPSVFCAAISLNSFWSANAIKDVKILILSVECDCCYGQSWAVEGYYRPPCADDRYYRPSWAASRWIAWLFWWRGFLHEVLFGPTALPALQQHLVIAPMLWEIFFGESVSLAYLFCDSSPKKI